MTKRAKPARVRYYVDADLLGLAKILVQLRSALLPVVRVVVRHDDGTITGPPAPASELGQAQATATSG
jgi:hypothetical protein